MTDDEAKTYQRITKDVLNNLKHIVWKEPKLIGYPGERIFVGLFGIHGRYRIAVLYRNEDYTHPCVAINDSKEFVMVRCLPLHAVMLGESATEGR